MGNKIQKTESNKNDELIVIDISHLSGGIYFVNISNILDSRLNKCMQFVKQ
jgi:hypothetical protein